jgi:hypothetical protein
MGVCCSLKPDEARELVPTKVLADLLLSLVTLQLPERSARTALIVVCLLTEASHLANCCSYIISG